MEGDREQPDWESNYKNFLYPTEQYLKPELCLKEAVKKYNGMV